MSGKRKPKKAPRRRQEIVDPKEDLKNKLKQKLREKQLERTCRVVRDNRMDDIEEKLENSKNPGERHKLKEELALLEKINEKETNSFTGEYPEYTDTANYGGGQENAD